MQAWMNARVDEMIAGHSVVPEGVSSAETCVTGAGKWFQFPAVPASRGQAAFSRRIPTRGLCPRHACEQCDRYCSGCEAFAKHLLIAVRMLGADALMSCLDLLWQLADSRRPRFK